jgi:hypothetical protein
MSVNGAYDFAINRWAPGGGIRLLQLEAAAAEIPRSKDAGAPDVELRQFKR